MDNLFIFVLFSILINAMATQSLRKGDGIISTQSSSKSKWAVFKYTQGAQSFNFGFPTEKRISFFKMGSRSFMNPLSIFEGLRAPSILYSITDGDFSLNLIDSVELKCKSFGDKNFGLKFDYIEVSLFRGSERKARIPIPTLPLSTGTFEFSFNGDAIETTCTGDGNKDFGSQIDAEDASVSLTGFSAKECDGPTFGFTYEVDTCVGFMKLVKNPKFQIEVFNSQDCSGNPTSTISLNDPLSSLGLSGFDFKLNKCVGYDDSSSFGFVQGANSLVESSGGGSKKSDGSSGSSVSDELPVYAVALIVIAVIGTVAGLLLALLYYFYNEKIKKASGSPTSSGEPDAPQEPQESFAQYLLHLSTSCCYSDPESSKNAPDGTTKDQAAAAADAAGPEESKSLKDRVSNIASSISVVAVNVPEHLQAVSQSTLSLISAQLSKTSAQSSSKVYVEEVNE